MSRLSTEAVLRTAAHARGEAPAVECNGEIESYNSLLQQARSVAGALRAALGPTPAPIAYMSRNGLPLVRLLLGAMIAGVPLVPINWRLNETEIRDLLEDAGATHIVCSNEFGAVAQACAEALGIALVDLGDGLLVEGLPVSGTGGKRDDLHPGTAFILYTSGTSGRPKGVMVGEHAILYPADVVRGRWLLDETSVHLVVSPLFHTAGLMNLIAGLISGAHNLLVEPRTEAMLRTIADRSVTNLMVVPAVLAEMVKAASRGADLSSLKCVVFGSDRSSVEMIGEAQRLFGSVITQGYGLTEVAGAVVSSSPELFAGRIDPEERLATVGLPFDGVDVRIAGTTAPCEVGEVLIRTPSIASGYLGLPRETEAAFTPDGFFRTGDLGFFDEDGFLYVSGRLKDLIISGGENIFPAEVERVLVSHPAIADAAVVGVPDQRWGQRVKAFVTLGVDGEASEEELIAHARRFLAKYKCPAEIEFMEELPRNSLGKIVKSAFETSEGGSSDAR